MLRASIFQKAGSFSNNNIRRTPRDFAPLAGLPLELGYENGITAAADWRVGDFLLPAAVFLFCIRLFLHEYDTGLGRLIRTAKLGRAPTAAAKLAALFTLTAAVELALCAGTIFTAQGLYGFGKLSRCIQSLPSFRDCTLRTSVGGFLAVYTLTKLGAAWLTAAIMALCFIVCGGGKSTFTALGLYAAVSFVCCRFIHSASWLNMLKYINIFSGWDVYNFYRLYININFFSYPLNRTILCTAAGAAAFLILVFAAGWCYAKGRLRDFAEGLFGRVGAWAAGRRSNRPLRGTVSVAAHELRKAFFTGRAWICPAAALLVTVCLWDVQPLRLSYADDAAYKLCANRWSGVLTDEKREEIEAERAYIEGIPQRMEELGTAYESGELSKEDYRTQYYELASYAQTRQTGFGTLYSQYTAVQTLPEGITQGIADRISADYWFDHETRDLLRGLLCVLLCTLACSRILPLDDEKGLSPLLRATPRGRAPALGGRLASAGLAALLIWCGLYAAPFATFFAKYRLAGDCGVQNLFFTQNQELEYLYRTMTLRISIGGWIAAVSLLQLLTACTVSVWTMWISMRTKKAGTTVLIAAVLFGAPFLLKLAGLDFVTALSPAAAFTGYQTLPVLSGAAWVYAGGVAGLFGTGAALLYRAKR